MARMIDRNGHRWGAAISMVALLVGFALQWRPIVPLLALVLAVGPVFGVRFSPLGATYRAIKRTFKLDIPVVPEEEGPPRFAQLVGALFLIAGSVAVYAGAEAIGWALALIVAALQGLLAATGICVGCEIYLVGKRFAARGAS